MIGCEIAEYFNGVEKKWWSEKRYDFCPVTGRQAADEIYTEEGNLVQTFGDYRTGYTRPVLDQDVFVLVNEKYCHDRAQWCEDEGESWDALEHAIDLLRSAAPHMPEGQEKLKVMMEYLVAEWDRDRT